MEFVGRAGESGGGMFVVSILEYYCISVLMVTR